MILQVTGNMEYIQKTTKKTVFLIVKIPYKNVCTCCVLPVVECVPQIQHVVF